MMKTKIILYLITGLLALNLISALILTSKVYSLTNILLSDKDQEIFANKDKAGVLTSMRHDLSITASYGSLSDAEDILEDIKTDVDKKK